jgi:hypothetical protein
MMKKIIRSPAILPIFFGLFFAAEAFGQLDGNPENLCRNGFFPREGKVYQMARITGKKGEKIYFYGDEREDCPDGKNCRRKNYLVPGNEIIVSRSLGGYACSWFQPSRTSETVGWIKIDDLEWIETDQKPADRDWVGEWRFYDNKLLISKSGKPGIFAVTGDAIWKGPGDNVHVGELDHAAERTGNKLELGSAEDCAVSMQLVGKYLIVSDNLKCGGTNVTFSGVYRKKR